MVDHSPVPDSLPGRRPTGPAPRPMRATQRVLVAALVGLPLCIAHAQHNWPAFRNDGSGTITVDRAPTRWSPGNNIAWQVSIPGYGQSAPVVWGESVFVTSCDGPWQEHGYVHAFDLRTGRKRWTTEVPASTKIENYFRNSRAAPTCVVDDKRVVSFFPGGDVTAMDHAGRTVWSVSLFAHHPGAENDRGTSSSLAQTDDLVFVLVDHNGPSYLLALHKTDGRLAWKAERGERGASWSSPVTATLAGQPVVIVSSAGSVAAYTCDAGERLWEIDGLEGNRIPSASVVGDSIFVGSTRPAHGSYDRDQVAAANCRIDVVRADGEIAARTRWGARRVDSYYSTPLVFGGYVYYVNKSGVLYCCDAETGRQVFVERIGDPCWASAIGVTTADGAQRAYFVMKNGETLILRPGDTFDPVARNQLWDEEQLLAAAASAREKRAANQVPPEQAPPKEGPEQVLAAMPEPALHRVFSYGDPTVYATAIVDRRLLIRTGQYLVCVQEESDPAKRRQPVP